MTSPWKVVEITGETIILYESRTIFRQIFTDGRAFPKDMQPAWQGYSIGRWDGDTFVVETIGLKDDTWLDLFGTPATGALHVTERFHRLDFGHMDLDITMTDPKAYSKPWPIKLHLNLMPDAEILEYACMENNRGMEHMVGK